MFGTFYVLKNTIYYKYGFVCNTPNMYIRVMFMSNSIGGIIREKRKELNLTQAQLAEMIGSDEYYISAIETGRRNPGSKFLVSLSNALSIPIDSLLGIESNFVLHKQVSDLELKIQKLNSCDREMLIDIFNKLVDRFLDKNIY